MTAAAADAGDAPPGLASRRVAYRVLRRVHGGGAWSGPALDRALRGARLDARDRAFAANLAYETLRWEGTLDWALARVVTRRLDDVEDAVRDVLRLGAWQLLFGRVPDRAVVSTSVDLSRAEISPRTAGFVNGVLRALARERERLPWPPPDDDRGLALATGHPEWVVASARQRFGDRARAVLEAGNTPPGVTLRAVADRDALLAELAAAGVAASGGRAATAVRAPGVDPGALAAVAEGRAVVQDDASQLVVTALAAAAGGLDGAVVYDACAAPGGKATHLAQLGARVVAGDVHPGRVGQLADLAARLDLRGEVLPVVADAAAPPLRAEGVDAVLLDAPCTGLGTVRRRPELRWRRSADDPARLGTLQLGLLEAVAELVRPGGVLVYSVCTWPQEETAEVVTAFLAAHGDRFTADQPDLGGAGTRLPGDPGVQLAPDADEVDGMYVALLRRR
ncbi:MAG TPA: 16S rRNA (cytosine(967)-C(5))-methyltransferase RsmB [Egibacteraceae bacterium]